MERPICPKCNERPCERYKLGHRSTCWKCRSQQNIPAYLAHYKRYKAKLRAEVIKRYGGRCECCQESNPLFMTIDHVNGGGRKHREQIGGGGYRLCYWLRKNNYPSGFRVLCWNCNCGRQLNNGICPHKNGPIE